MSKLLKITILGDSIAVGQGVTIADNWVHSLARSFPEVLVTNASQNGRTTRLALESMQYEVQGHSPNLLIVGLGLNDANYWSTDKGSPRVSLRSYKSNLIEIHDRAKVWGIERVLFLNNHPTRKGLVEDKFDYDRNAKLYSKSIGSVVKMCRESLLIDTWSACEDYVIANGLSHDALLLPDGVHLSKLGHEVYSLTILNFLSENAFS